MNQITTINLKTAQKYCGRRGSLALVAIGAAFWVYRWRKRKNLREKAVAKRRKEQDYIQQKLRSLEDELDQDTVNEILQYSGTELWSKLQNGALDPVLVIKVYMYKACKETQGTNCVTQIIRECEKQAEELRSKDPKSHPLYGMPVSLKESMRTKGTPSMGGMTMFIDDIPAEDGELAQVLKHLGAVPFVKTNTPQVMLSFMSSNPIYGETSNPHNHNFAPGGSSSGEGALIGGGGSVLGFGSDVAGSIRMPAHFCGICGIKPTKHRLSVSGTVKSAPGQVAIAGMLGPMAKDVDTLVMAMRALLCDKMFELDKNVPIMKFNEEVYLSKRPLRIGYYEDDGYTKPMPSCSRAVRMTKEALEKAGHTLVPYKVPDIELMMNYASRAFYPDGGQTLRNRLRYDIVDVSMLHAWRRCRMPDFLRNALAFFMRFQSPRMANDLLAYGGGSAYELWQIQDWIGEYKHKFWEEWRVRYKIDALVCPVYPLVACPKAELFSMTELMNYTTPYTLTNCPAGTVTITTVTEQDIEDLKHHKGHYGDRWDRRVKKACMGSINMPVGVQCVAPPWQEEMCLRVMKEVETLLVKTK